MGIVTRRPDLTPEQFRRHWVEVHGPLVARLPGLRRYHQNHVIDASQLAIDPVHGSWEVHGFSQLWFDDVDAMRRASESAEAPPIVLDIAKFCGELKLVVCRPNTVIPVATAAGPLVKRMAILTRRPEVTAEHFRDDWFGFHAEAVRKLPNLMGYTQNLVVDRGGADLTSLAPYDKVPVDGIAEFWFRSVDDMEAAFSSPAAEVSERHALDFIGTTAAFLVEMHVIV